LLTGTWTQGFGQGAASVPGKHEEPPRRGGSSSINDVPATTYSPTQLPGQYHRRWRA
jgi:hypothetical protein